MKFTRALIGISVLILQIGITSGSNIEFRCSLISLLMISLLHLLLIKLACQFANDILNTPFFLGDNCMLIMSPC